MIREAVHFIFCILIRAQKDSRFTHMLKNGFKLAFFVSYRSQKICYVLVKTCQQDTHH